MLKLRYDVFGAEALGDAKFVGRYEFPEVRGTRLSSLSKRVVPFDRLGSLTPGDWIHFYVHDKRFHQFLARRGHYWSKLVNAGGFVGVDNSMYRDLPLAEQIHSCYLNRAIDYYLLKQYKPVVPNVSWGDWRSYDFCFDGIEANTTVAVSTYGCSRSRSDKVHFEDGFAVMLERLNPFSVVLHGSLWSGLKDLCEYRGVPMIRIPTQRDRAYAVKEVCHG